MLCISSRREMLGRTVGGPGLHDTRHTDAGRRGHRLRPDHADDDVTCHHGDQLPIADHLGDVGQRGVGADPRDVGMDDGARTFVVTEQAVAREALRQPRCLAGDVVVHVGEPKLLEPARGSGTEISLVVEAVDDDRPGRVETLESSLDLIERKVHRAGDVLLDERLRGQHVDELCALGDELTNLLGADGSRHPISLPGYGQKIRRRSPLAEGSRQFGPAHLRAAR
jgi:hypothetical protein